jgi:hypothetical protein
MKLPLKKLAPSLKIAALMVSLGLSVVACGASDSGEDAADGAEEAIQAGMSSLSGSISLGSESSGALASHQLWNPISSFASLFTVYAADQCGVPAIRNQCVEGVRSATYEACSGRRGSYSGSVTLTFSQSTCRMTQSGDSATRTVEMQRTGFHGRTIQTTSQSSADYRGITIGGGTQIERTGVSALEVSILGLHKTATLSNGEEGFDIHTRTTSPLVISGQLNGSRTISSGVIEVSHNKAEFLATMTLADLEYDADECCYPIAGSVTVEYSGSQTGSRTIEFDGSCGSVNVENQGVQKVLSLPGCD